MGFSVYHYFRFKNVSTRVQELFHPICSWTISSWHSILQAFCLPAYQAGPDFSFSLNRLTAKRHIESMLTEYWATVEDAGPTSIQHRVNVQC